MLNGKITMNKNEEDWSDCVWFSKKGIGNDLVPKIILESLHLIFESLLNKKGMNIDKVLLLNNQIKQFIK